MELCYRGSTYTSKTETVETSALPITGTYRGQVVTFKLPQTVPQSIVMEELTYRGIRYVPGDPCLGDRPVNSSLMMKFHRSRKTHHPAFRGN